MLTQNGTASKLPVVAPATKAGCVFTQNDAAPKHDNAFAVLKGGCILTQNDAAPKPQIGQIPCCRGRSSGQED